MKDTVELLKDIVKSAEKLENGKTVFKDQRTYEILGVSVLNPCNDYTYEWTCHLLERAVEYLEQDKDIEDLYEDIDSLVDIYTSDLTNWLSHHDGNLQYLDQVLQQGATSAGQALQQAQYLAIEETTQNLCSKIQELLDV